MQYDAVIIGGGPAGLAIASELSRTRRTPMLDRFINLFNDTSPNHIDPIYCEKVFTLDITNDEVRTVLGAILKVFHLKALFGILQLDDYLLLVEEAAAFVGESVVDEVRHWLHLGGTKPQDPTRINGFDFA